MNRRNLITIIAGVVLLAVVGIGVFFASQAANNQAPNDSKASGPTCTWVSSACKSGCSDDKDVYNCPAYNPPPNSGPIVAPPSAEKCGGISKGSTQCSGCTLQVCTCSSATSCGMTTVGPSTSCGASCSNPPTGNTGTGTATGNSCAQSGSASQCGGKAVGTSIPVTQTGSCVCTINGANNVCGCVPPAGSSCLVLSSDPGCGAIGASCIKGGAAGTCIAGGSNGQSCTCKAAPASNNVCVSNSDCTVPNSFCNSTKHCEVTGTTTTGSTCTSNASCLSGQFCGSDKKCAAKLINNSTACSANIECLSGICGSGGVCVAPGTTGASSFCTTDAQCSSDKFCNSGACVTKKASGQTSTCSANNQCQTGLCISNVCRTAGAAGGGCTSGGTTYSNGQWRCDPSQGEGFGQQCSGGSFNPTFTKTDACAPPVGAKNCSQLTTQSGGEASNGRFVGCNGALNCFCNGTAASEAPHCQADAGNDSCGAGSANTGGTVDQPPTTGGSNGGTTTTPPPPPQVNSTPYCGDAICATNELCERTSSGAGTFKACSVVGGAPTGATVPACYGIQFSQPVQSTTCRYCGDSVFTPGTEQCDSTAPATGGNNAAQCDSNCVLQPVANVCVSMTENGVDPIRSGASNFLQYTLIYQNNSTTNPFPNIRLLVSTGNTVATAVGRDANSITNVLVAPIPVGGYSYDAVTSRHTYTFRWESVSTAGVPVPDATYQVRGLTDGTDAGITTSPAACTESLTASAVAVQEPLFNIIKTSAVSCVDNSDATVNYTVTVTNVGPVSGVVDFVTDTLDPLVTSLAITPTNINPSFGSYASGVITWTGTVGDRTFTAGQSKTYTYSIVIPVGQLLNFSGGVQNLAAVQYDTNTTNNNTTSFNLRTVLNCTINGIPITGIFDDGRLFLFGLIFIILGFIAYRYQLGKTISEKLISSAVSTAEEFMPFEDRIERKMEKKMKDEK